MIKTNNLLKLLIRKRGIYVSFYLVFILTALAYGQQTSSFKLNWEIESDALLKRNLLTFNNSALVNEVELTSFFSYQSKGFVRGVTVVKREFVSLTSLEEKLINKNIVAEELNIQISRGQLKSKPFNVVSFYPIIKTKNGEYKKLISFDLVIEYGVENNSGRSGVRSYAPNSILGNGTWHKFGIIQDGIYKLTFAELLSFGVDLSAVDPRTISLYGNGGGVLPSDNWIERPDDLEECAIRIIGEEDGRFDSQDYILFYGKGQDNWSNNGENYIRTKNPFSDTTYYFLKIGGAPGKRIGSVNSVSGANVTVSSFDAFGVYELDRINLIKSGSRWLGEEFEINTSQNFSFQFKNIVLGSTLKVRSSLVAASVGSASSFSVSAGGVSETYVINSVTGSYAAIAAYGVSEELLTTASVEAFDVGLTFNKSNSSANGWLDYIEIIARRKLQLNSGQLLFRDNISVGENSIAEFVLAGGSNSYYVWDVSDNNNVNSINYSLSSASIVFSAVANELKEYAAFTVDQSLLPIYCGKVENQDLHSKAIEFPDYLIITHKDFVAAANDLAMFHEEKDGLSSLVVTTEQVYNEFSSGAQDITGIKDFVKMFYDQAAGDSTKQPRYLLLFGDGSYDYRDLKVGNTNFVPAYQSANSFDPVGSYVSDDYFGLLDDEEGDGVNDIIDIGIGRFPVQTVVQANDMVDKVKAYYKTESMKPWRNWIGFIGDDEDNNLHMSQADDLANTMLAFNPLMNVDKIYLDAYPQVSGAGGNRYPLAAAALDNRVKRGALLINYVGHGGELGWTHERVLDNPTINAWENIENMPLFLTATCEFSRFDDPERTSAGENVLLNSKGGGIALLTTTRLVFSHLNKSLMDAFYIHGFSKMNKGAQTLGDLAMITKQFGPKAINTRNFSLLGDPALRLAYPEYNVASTNVPDTVKALSRVTIYGEVRDGSGVIMSNFNGVVHPAVFDKIKNVNTLNNEGEGIFEFQLQKNILFKGKASVVNGAFQFTFVAPKDIDFAYGSGRISYYAENGVIDAGGFDTNFIIGGFNENSEEDNQGPEIELYINDESFVSGGITNQNPLLIAKFSDENGMNTTGNGVGHDIVSVLDDNTMESIVLNDFYESALNDFSKGEVRYQLSLLDEGRHEIYVKGWDVFNNSGESYTEFIVATDSKMALDHVLNYPNPFTTKTSFYFEHNQIGDNLEVKIQIFTVSGKVVKTLNHYAFGDKTRIGPIDWDGKDDYGDNIGKGVYVYKVSVKNDSGDQIDKFEKLVLLK